MPGPITDRRVFVPAAVALALGTAYVISLLPFVRGDAGTQPLLDTWLNLAFKLAAVVVVAVRGWVDRRMRAAWWCLAGALLVAFAGSVGYYAHYQYLDPVPFPSWSDAGFIGFYVLAYAAGVLMLRDRIWPFPRSMWLDGLIAAFTAAAFAAAFVLEPALQATGGRPSSVAVTLAYPIADLLLIMLLAGAFVLVGAPGRTWGWLGAGLLIFFVTDALYVEAASTGTYDPGDPLDIGWTAARLCFIVATLQAWRQTSAARGGATRLLVAPALCSAASLGLLYAGTQTEISALAASLALVAVIAALSRTVLAFRELRALAETRRQALTDELTGLPNRRAFQQALGDATAAGPAAVLLLDLNRFKDVNDSLGHATGDELLRHVAARLASVVRPRDVLARLGGDEFAVVTAVEDGHAASMVARRLADALTAPFEIGAAELHASPSIGIALYPDQATSADELLQLADLAMYAAKDRGEALLVFDQQRDGAGRHRLEIVAQLREAIHKGQMFLDFQPKIDLGSGRVIGVEALVRWRHPSRGVLGPQHFVELAESSGAMRALTGAVLDLALAQTRRWHDRGLALTVAVNISTSDLADESFPEHVEERLSAYRLPAGALVLEITESRIMEDRRRAARALDRLRRLGVGVAVDDFGTGYSSLAYLVDLPLTEVKLDRAFVTPLQSSRRASSVLESAVGLATALDLIVVAEGVEDRPTLEALKRAGCTQAQGFYIGRPTTPDQVAAKVADEILALGDLAPAALR